MTDPSLAAVVLAAGKGTRMHSDRPKVLHRVANRPMVLHVTAALAGLDPARIVVVVGQDMDAVAAAVAPHPTVVQDEPLGTGHAVLVARDALADFARPGKDVVVVFGDTPLITADSLQKMLAARRSDETPALVLLGFRPQDPSGYGRILRDESGRPIAIVEHKDATEAQREIKLCNGGMMLADGGVLFGLLQEVGNDNAKGEYYLTDLAALAHAQGLPAAVVEVSEEEVMGVNSRAELAAAEAVMQARLRGRAMAAGVTLVDPATVWLSADTRFGRDVTVYPNVFLGPGVAVGDGAEIRSFSHLEQAEVGPGALVGPFARLRPGAKLGAEVHVGNFVEIKNATLEAGAKANHLAYIGDASVGAKSNVGAGVITCNYDGFAKHRTEIGAGTFIGTNASLVAPVSIGDGAFVGAGSTITDDVPADAFAVARGGQETREGGGARYRDRKRAEKQAKEGQGEGQREGTSRSDTRKSGTGGD